MTRNLRAAFVAGLMGLFAGFSAHAQAPQPPEIAARAYLLVDLTAQQTLAELDADKPIEPASLTKLMSAYLVFDALKSKKSRCNKHLASANALGRCPARACSLIPK